MKNPVPSYCRHKPSGQAVVTVPVGGDRRRDVYLGRYGSEDSKREYARALAQLRADPAPAPAAPPHPGRADLTVNELLVKFLAHADSYCRHADGTPTSEPGNYRHALRSLRTLYGHSPAAEFGPLALKAVRQSMVAAGLCRPLVNQAVGRVKRAFGWAAGEELIGFETFQRLTAVAGLTRGRSAAREPARVAPADPDAVAATLPFLPPSVAAMARAQSLTGMRSGEVCRMTAGAIDRPGVVWRYSPETHKGAWRGKSRVVPLGPRSQGVLRPFLDSSPRPESPLFSPARERTERFARMRSGRKSKVQPSQACRAKAAAGRVPGDRYLPTSYAHAVARGLRRANAARESEGLPGIAHWSPNRLRHAFATRVRATHGLEAAQVLLGHARADVTQVYARRDHAKAAAAALEIG